MVHLPAKTQLYDTTKVLYDRLTALQERLLVDSGGRILVALAGVPGFGKSMIATALAEISRQQEDKNLAILPMDGFHFPKSTLCNFDRPDDAFRYRGAPFTFDVQAFVRLVKALKLSPVTFSDEPELAIQAPSFNHAVQDPIDEDIYISSADKVVILEGNYLLLDEAPWKDIASLVHERWFVEVSDSIAKQRLIDRHLRAGIETTRDAAEVRAESNDMRNAHLIRKRLVSPDVVIHN
ncbi:nicotinamide riboside kinase [Glonium stellatum]|uniref:Nicotinamide riboside kinase n=1 Tax=Glonium stellatum TaxID=574774 RepID=A0A8E2EPK6_9PEZI|nr:nicotinamide riboside kinase [Glonium stellatum]